MAYLDLSGLQHLGQRLSTVFLRKDQVVNNVTTTTSGSVLDARQGKALQDAVNGKIGMSTGTATLTTSGWTASGSNYVQTVSFSGVTSSSTVIVVAAPASHTAYANNMVYCSAQSSGKLTFTATVKPTAALTVNVMILK